MGLDRIDLHLIHWPNPRVGQVRRGLAGTGRPARGGAGPVEVGVSNFTEAHLQRVIDETGVTPVVNQIELHPYFPQPEMRAVHEAGRASAPSRGARSASGRHRSPSRRWPPPPRSTAVSPGR